MKRCTEDVARYDVERGGVGERKGEREREEKTNKADKSRASHWAFLGLASLYEDSRTRNSSKPSLSSSVPTSLSTHDDHGMAWRVNDNDIPCMMIKFTQLNNCDILRERLSKMNKCARNMTLHKPPFSLQEREGLSPRSPMYAIHLRGQGHCSPDFHEALATPRATTDR